MKEVYALRYKYQGKDGASFSAKQLESFIRKFDGFLLIREGIYHVDKTTIDTSSDNLQIYGEVNDRRRVISKLRNKIHKTLILEKLKD